MSEQVTESTPSEEKPDNGIEITDVAGAAGESEIPVEPANTAAEEPAELVLVPEAVVAEQEIVPTIDVALFKNILEAALLTSQEPLAMAELKKLVENAPPTAQIEALLKQLAEEYSTRGIELTQVASGWRFRARQEMQQYLNRLNPQKQPRYSRAVMETLAIIAYRQPVTRGDIEDIRGVAVASPILKTLEARNWIEVIGTRDVPGKPELFATTPQLLDDLNLRSLHELPELEEMGNLLEQGAPDGA